MHQFRDKSAGAARAGLRRAPLLPGADGRRRARLPRRTRCRWGRTSASTSSSCATWPSTSTRASARRWSCPRATSRGRRARARPAGRPSARCRPPAAPRRAPSTSTRSPTSIVKKFRAAPVTDSGTEIVRRAGQARHHQPDRDPRRGPRHHARGDRGRVRRLRLRRLQDRGGRREVAEWLAPVRERYLRAARGHRAHRGHPRGRAPTRRGRSRPGWSATCARRMGVGPPRRSVSPAA